VLEQCLRHFGHFNRSFLFAYSFFMATVCTSMQINLAVFTSRMSRSAGERSDAVWLGSPQNGAARLGGKDRKSTEDRPINLEQNSM